MMLAGKYVRLPIALRVLRRLTHAMASIIIVPFRFFLPSEIFKMFIVVISTPIYVFIIVWITSVFTPALWLSSVRVQNIIMHASENHEIAYINVIDFGNIATVTG